MIYRLFGHNDTLMSDRQLTSWTKCYCVRGVCWVFTWIVSFVFNTKLAFLPRSPTMCWVQEMTWNTVWVLSVLQLHTLWSWFGFVLSQHLQSLICTLASTDTLLCNISFYIIDSSGKRSAMLQLFCITLLWYCLSNCVLRALFSNSVLLYWPHYS